MEHALNNVATIRKIIALILGLLLYYFLLALLTLVLLTLREARSAAVRLEFLSHGVLTGLRSVLVVDEITSS